MSPGGKNSHCPHCASSIQGMSSHHQRGPPEPQCCSVRLRRRLPFIKIQTIPHKRAPIAPSLVSALPSLYSLWHSFPLLEAQLSFLHFLLDRGTAEPCSAIRARLRRVLPRTWPHPLVMHSRLDRCTVGALGKQQRKAQSRGFRSTRQCLERPVEVPVVGLPARPPLPFSGQRPALSFHFTARVWAGRALPSQVIMGPGSAALHRHIRSLLWHCRCLPK